jgi:hypothetical protein
MVRVLHPTARLDPYHKLMHSLYLISTRIKELSKKSKEKKRIEQKNQRMLFKAFELLKAKKLIFKPNTKIINGITLRFPKMTSKDDVDGYQPSTEEINNYIKKLTEILSIKKEDNYEYELLSLYLIKIVSIFEYYLVCIFRMMIKESEILIKKSLEGQINFFMRRDLGFPYVSLRTDRAIEFISTRNIILHNDGYINSRYINRVKHPRGENGQQIELTYKYLFSSIEFFLNYSRSIDDTIAKKIFKISYIKKTKSSGLRI